MTAEVCATPDRPPLPPTKARCGVILTPELGDGWPRDAVPSSFVCTRAPHPGDDIHHDERGAVGTSWTDDGKTVRVHFGSIDDLRAEIARRVDPTAVEEAAYGHGLEAGFRAALEATRRSAGQANARADIRAAALTYGLDIAPPAIEPALPVCNLPDCPEAARSAHRITYGRCIVIPAVPDPTGPEATRPSCVCPVGGYSIKCHRGDHRQNAAEGMTDR